jgi:hypothetical protein
LSALSDSPSSRRRALQPSAGQFKRVIYHNTEGPADLDARRALAGPLVVLFPRPATDARAGGAGADDDQIEVRVETARILGRILARAASEIRSSADSLKSPAVQLRSKCVSILYRLLKDRIGDVRAAAADLLGDGGLDPSVAAELIAAAGDSDRGVRLEIARTLLRINFDVRRAALDLLSIIIEDTRAEMPNQADAR